MTPDISSVTGFRLAGSATGATQADGTTDGKVSGGAAAAVGDTVAFSPEGLRKAAEAAKNKDEEDSDAEKRLKEVQKKIQELQEQIREVQAENLPEKVKLQKIQGLQTQLAQYQAEMVKLQRAVFGTSGNPGGTRAEGAPMSLT